MRGETDRRQRMRIALAVFIAALAIRLLVWSENVSHPAAYLMAPDSFTYFTAADDLRGVPGAFAGREWRRAERTPIYPLWLALWLELGVGSRDHPAPIAALQAGLSAASTALAVYVAAGRLPLRWALTIGAIGALEPSSVAHAGLLLTEPLYEFVLGALLLAFVRARERSRAGAVGLVLAAAIAPLIRPVGLYLPIVAAAVCLVWLAPGVRRARRATILLLALALAPSALWSARNFAYTGNLTLSITSAWGSALFARDVEVSVGAPTEAEPGTQPPWTLDFGRDRGLSEAQIAASRSVYVRDVLTTHPVAAAGVWLRNFVLLVGVPDAALPAQLLADAPVPAGKGVRARLAWLGALGLTGVWLAFGMGISVAGIVAVPVLLARWRSRTSDERALLALVAAVVLYHLVLGALVAGQGARYRAPLAPYLAWLVVWAARELVPRRAR